jgi:chemotaxis protein methyltransferase CheR
MIDFEIVERFRDALGRRLGWSFDSSRLGSLGEVLARRSSATCSAAAAYVARLDGAPLDELAELARELTVGETYFFRHTEQFRAFGEICATTRPSAILSAGCASGEEAYTLAMVVREIDPHWSPTIVAVDLNPAALERAGRGRFSTWAFRETEPAQRARWFHRDGASTVIDPAIRAMVRFARHNLAEDDPALWAIRWDVVFCRNVLMYFTPTAARAAIARIARAITPGGHLFLGHAETLRGLSTDFHLRHAHDAFYYQRRRPDEALDAPSAVAPAIPITTSLDVPWVDAIHRASARIAALTDPAIRTPAPSQAPARPASHPEPGLAGVLDLVRDERYADALAAVHALPADDTDAILLQAVLLVHAGRLAEAEATCRRLLAIDDLDAGAHYVLALAREGAGDLAVAAEHDRLAIHLDSSFAMPRLHLGLLARRAGDRRTAREELAAAELLLDREDASRVLLFGGGFGRDALIALCRTARAALETSP